MGIQQKYGIEVYRKRNGKWTATHHDGSTTEASKSLQKHITSHHPASADNDWIIDLQSGNVLFVPDSDMYENGTLWRFDGSEWHSIYHRSHGNIKPGYLEIMKSSSKAGDIIIEKGPNDEINGYNKYGKALLFSPEIAAVYDNNSGLEQPFQADLVPDDRQEEQLAQRALAVAAIVDGIISVRQNLANIGAEWAEFKPGDGITKKMAKTFLKALEEANPSPTPGTTAINDYVGFANDVVTGSKDLDLDGSSEGILRGGQLHVPESSNDAIKDIVYCKISGELLAGCGALLDYVKQLRTLVTTENIAPGSETGRNQFNGVLNTAAASAMIDSPKIVLNLFNATDKIIQLADSASSAASASSTAAVVLAPVGVVVGIIVGVRHIRKAHKARKRWWLYKSMLSDSTVAPYDEDLQACLKYLIGKSGRRLRTHAALASTALIGAAGSGVLAVTAIVGGANAWNPVGWTLLGIAAVGGIGIVGYKLYKRYNRKKRHTKRAIKYRKITDSDSAARKLIEIYRGRLPERDTQAAGLILESMGVNISDLEREDAKEAAVAMVVRHLDK